MRKLYIIAILFLSIALPLGAQTIPSPKQFFGFDIGDDYQLANYTQTEIYFKKLSASPRTKYTDIGLTEEGRHQFMLVVSSPANIKQLERYKSISQKLTRAEGLTDAMAHKLAAEGKTIVWIDGGLHASETVGAHQLIQTAYNMVSREDDEAKRILDHVIILFVHANPDGQKLVSNWYMQEKDPKKRKMNVPRLWEKYIGHDNNRDFFMMNMKESQNIARQQYLEWLPQIIYNHHQAGPAGSVVAGPPYRDPFNYVCDPLLITSIDAVGAAMSSRLNEENKPGYTERSGTSFSTWWNGGLRTTAYFHNMVGLLTEIIGSPTPSEIPLVPERLIPNGATPFPVTPQKWHFKESIDYSVALNYAVLDYAVRHHDELLYNAYRMGKNSILRGSEDYWTLSPKKVEAIQKAFQDDQKAAVASGGKATRLRGGELPVKYYDLVLKNPALRDPRGYIIPANQPDFPTAVKFINALIKSGLIIHKASDTFTVAGKHYPKGSYIVKTDQAFRPHVLDMFEPQTHPNDFPYPGGPPVKPYDIAGWTLAYQMGVQFDRILEGFNGPFVRIPYGQRQTPPAQPFPAVALAGYFLSANANDAFIAVNDLLNAGADVYRLTATVGDFEPGTFYVSSTDNKSKTVLQKSAEAYGLKVAPAPNKPTNLVKLSAARVGIWDTYGGSIPSGWVRWLMEQYHYNYKLIYPQEIDAGNLKDKFDVIVFVSGAIPTFSTRRDSSGGDFDFPGRNPRAEELPEAYRNLTGRVTAEKSIPQIKAFLNAGGSVVTISSSSNLAYHLGLPIRNALVEINKNGIETPLPDTKFYIPGSVLRLSLDKSQPANWGMFSEADVDFDSSPAFKLDSTASARGVKPLAWFSTDAPLRSGWAWGQQYLKNDVAAFSAQVGAGMLYAFGPEITFRGQAHGTFKLLFNELYINTGR